jgi:hypothetical protein
LSSGCVELSIHSETKPLQWSPVVNIPDIRYGKRRFAEGRIALALQRGET